MPPGAAGLPRPSHAMAARTSPQRRSAKNVAVDLKSELEGFQRSLEGMPVRLESPRKMLCWEKGLRFLVVDDSIPNRWDTLVISPHRFAYNLLSAVTKRQINSL